MGSYMFLILFAAAILGTWWGWSRILIPFGIPVVNTGFRLVHATIITILIIAPLNTGWWFRTYGYDIFDLAYIPLLDTNQQQKFKWMRENNLDLRGNWEPNWRINRGLTPLPKNWNGNSDHSMNPIWSLLIPIMIVGGYIFFENNYRRRHGLNIASDRAKRHRQKTPSMAELNIKYNEKIAKYANCEPFNPVVNAKPVASASVTSDNNTEFTQALRNLGYKNDVIRDVAQQCDEKDLEARVRHALRILSRK